MRFIPNIKIVYCYVFTSVFLTKGNESWSKYTIIHIGSFIVFSNHRFITKNDIRSLKWINELIRAIKKNSD